MQILITNLQALPYSLDIPTGDGDMIRERLLPGQTIDVGDRTTPYELNRQRILRELMAASDLDIAFVASADDFVPVPGSGGGGGYTQLQSSGSNIAQRTTADFRNGLQAVDSGGISRVEPLFGASANQVAQGNDARFPTAGQAAALAGTSGAPGAGNPYVTDLDARNANARTPTAHATSHRAGGTDPVEAGIIRETGGPQNLAVGAWALNQYLRRAGGNTAIGDDPVTEATVRAALALASAAISFNSQRLSSVADPSGPQDAATRAYVDAVATGLTLKTPARVATTANITLSGPQTIDGVAVIAGERVLVKNQSTGQDNGLYDVAAGAWSRSSDANTSAEVVSGLLVLVTEGSTNDNSAWVLTTNNPIVLGTTPLTFTQFGTGGGVTDHGALTGLADDDHTQYVLVAGTRPFTGAQSFGSNRATSIADPTADQDAATRLWTLQFGLRRPVRVATIVALPAYTRTTNTITANANGALPSIDGVSLSVNDRILLKNGAAGADNGLYSVSDLGSAGTPFVFIRSDAADASNEVFDGMQVVVREGTLAGQVWALTTNDPITLNTTALTFTQIGGPAASATQAGLMSATDKTKTDLLYPAMMRAAIFGTSEFGNASVTGASIYDTATYGDLTLTGTLTARAAQIGIALRISGTLALGANNFTCEAVYAGGAGGTAPGAGANGVTGTASPNASTMANGNATGGGAGGTAGAIAGNGGAGNPGATNTGTEQCYAGSGGSGGGSGGSLTTVGFTGGNGGASISGTPSAINKARVYFDPFVFTALSSAQVGTMGQGGGGGGSGGGGGNGGGTGGNGGVGGTGGNGAGFVWVAARFITGTGTIRVNGSNGLNGLGGSNGVTVGGGGGAGGGGGGGGGGVLRALYESVDGTVVFQANGGGGGTGSTSPGTGAGGGGNGNNGANGGTGQAGQIFQRLLVGN